MNRENVHLVLNELIGAERHCLFGRLIESTVFVSESNSADLEFVRRTVAQHEAHLRQLIELLIQLGGEPTPARGDIHSADFHFVDMHVLWPRVLAREEVLAGRFEQATAHLEDCPPALTLAQEITTRHRGCAEYLRKRCAAME